MRLREILLGVAGPQDYRGGLVMPEKLLEGLPYGHFAVIAADVPSKYITRSEKGMGRSAERHYPTMGHSELLRLDVISHAAPDAFLFYWVTGPLLAIGAHI